MNNDLIKTGRRHNRFVYDMLKGSGYKKVITIRKLGWKKHYLLTYLGWKMRKFFKIV